MKTQVRIAQAMFKGKTLRIKLSDAVIGFVLTVCVLTSSIILSLRVSSADKIIHRIPNYNDFLNDSNIFGRLVQSGFTKLDNLSDDYLVALKSASIVDSYLLLNYTDDVYIFDGENMLKTQGLVGDSIKFGKYAFTKSGKLGLKSILGETVIQCMYESIEFERDTAIGLLDGTFHIYYKGVKIGELSKSVEICQNPRFVMVDNGEKNLFFDLENGFSLDKSFNPPVLSQSSDWVLLSEPSEQHGIFMFYDVKNTLIGYAQNDKILIEPSFYSANRFKDGVSCATIMNGKPLKQYLRYKNGSILATNLDVDLANAEILPFYDDYAVYFDYTYGMYGVVDSDFNIVIKPSFRSIHQRILNGLVLDLEVNAFYSINKNSYVDAEGVTALYEDFFICRDLDGKYSVRDRHLQPLVKSCDYAFYFNESKILLVIYGNQCYRFSYA